MRSYRRLHRRLRPARDAVLVGAALCGFLTANLGLPIFEPASVALDNALLLKRVEALSVTDDLTQLYNSRYLNQVLRRETKRASRSGRPLSLLFIDLDGFKAVNDTHGHLFASRALVEAAAVIRQSARETDVVSRFGGDEFALVLPGTDLLAARHQQVRVEDGAETPPRGGPILELLERIVVQLRFNGGKHPLDGRTIEKALW